MIYILELQPQNDSNPISLREILGPMQDPVKRLALDVSQTYLAVAYGTQVAIYQRFGDLHSESAISMQSAFPTFVESCSGDVSLSADERFIAMTTLDQSVVTYPMSHDGPSIEEINIYEFPEKSRESPTLPVALTPSNLVLSGTAVGDVAVVYPNAALAFSLHQSAARTTSKCISASRPITLPAESRDHFQECAAY
ncbi:hypothetical protein FRC10_011012 [Ceratobasidium sp. 414]|nr:hypothetical protein FRC10_011012 [Ceratobasidium sp. 414]